MYDNLTRTDLALIEAHDRGYRVTKKGVLCNPAGKCLRGHPGPFGYQRMTYYSKVGRANIRVNRLQAYQKFGDALFSCDEVRHLDGNHKNNSWDNIAIGSKSDNELDKPKAVRVRSAKTAARTQRSLSDSEVRQLRRDRVNGKTYAQLMVKYGIAKSTVSYVVNRKTYRDE